MLPAWEVSLRDRRTRITPVDNGVVLEIPMDMPRDRRPTTATLPVLVIVPAHSRFICGTMLPTRHTPDLLLGMWTLIAGFGRVPSRLIWDNETWMGQRRRLAAGVAEFCGTLATRVHQLKPLDPESKGVVERRNGFFETSFMPGRDFESPAGFNAQFERANRRQVRTIRARRSVWSTPIERRCWLAADPTASRLVEPDPVGSRLLRPRRFQRPPRTRVWEWPPSKRCTPPPVASCPAPLTTQPYATTTPKCSTTPALRASATDSLISANTRTSGSTSARNYPGERPITGKATVVGAIANVLDEIVAQGDVTGRNRA
jgi:hypothetical protein